MSDATKFRGDDIPARVSVTDEDGNPSSLTGCTLYFTVKSNTEDPDSEAVIKLTATDADFSDPSSGIHVFVLPASITSGMEGLYHYDAQVKIPSGYITTVQEGSIFFRPDVTLQS